MRGLSVRMSPVGRAQVIAPADQTPILDVVVEHRSVLTLTPRHLDEVSDEELEAARSLLAALRVFVEQCERWTVPAALKTPAAPTQVGGAA